MVSDKPYDYTEARRYCLSQGYAIVPYQDKIINEPVPTLCFGDAADGKGCWVGGRVGNTCAFVDPRGNGGPYQHDCNKKEYVVCYGRYRPNNPFNNNPFDGLPFGGP